MHIKFIFKCSRVLIVNLIEEFGNALKLQETREE